jgi:hypothetical protein
VLALMAGCPSLSSIHRFGEFHPEVLELLGLRRSPSVATETWRDSCARSRWQKWPGHCVALLKTCWKVVTREPLVVAADGKTLRGVWEEGQQLGVVHLFAHQSQLALDQARTLYHVDEARVTRQWLEEMAGQFPGLAVLTGDALLADRSLCAAVVEHGQDYLVKLKKTNRPSMKRYRLSSPKLVSRTWWCGKRATDGWSIGRSGPLATWLGTATSLGCSR